MRFQERTPAPRLFNLTDLSEVGSLLPRHTVNVQYTKRLVRLFRYRFAFKRVLHLLQQPKTLYNQNSGAKEITYENYITGHIGAYSVPLV